MSNADPMLLLKMAALLCSLCFGAAFGRALLLGMQGPVGRLFVRYSGSLDTQLRTLLLPPRGAQIAAGQLAVSAVVLVLTLFTKEALLLLGIPLAALAPRVFLGVKRHGRKERIELKLDGFALTLANATRATPSIGRALELVQKVLPDPLDEEVELVLREMRVGASVDQALLGMSARINSVALDAVFSGVLIGRQVGGNLPLILETTSSTLREMARLDGVLRAKTAESKAQTWVLAAFPLVILFGFNTASPGYFNVLSNTPLGMLLMTIAIALWVTAIVVARKILAVQL